MLQLFACLLMAGHAHGQASPEAQAVSLYPDPYCGNDNGKGGTVIVPTWRGGLSDGSRTCTGCGPTPAICENQFQNNRCYACGFTSHGAPCLPYRCPQPDGTIMCSSNPDCSDAVPMKPPPPDATSKWKISVWGNPFGSQDCTPDDKPTATATFTTAACNCLIALPGMGTCFVSATLDVTSHWLKHDTINAQLFAGGGCTGDSLGGDTTITCGDCISQTVLTGAVAIKVTCPFSWWSVLVGIIIVIVAVGVGAYMRYRYVHGLCIIPGQHVSHGATTNAINAPQQGMLATPLLPPSQFGGATTATQYFTPGNKLATTEIPSTSIPNAAVGAGLLQEAQITGSQDKLTDFCATHKLAAFELALIELGVSEPSELADVTDEQLTSIGINAIQLKRVRQVVPCASDRANTPASAVGPTMAATSLDESVAVVSGGGDSSIGGAE